MQSDQDFERFVRLQSSRLLGTATLMVGDRGIAEDLTQETLIRVYRSWNSIEESSAAGADAHRTLVRLCRRRARGIRVRREVLTAEPDTDSACSFEGAVSTRMGLVKGLLDIPLRQRETVILRYYCGLTIAETGEALRCAEGTVKSQCAKGLLNLKLALESYEDFDEGRKTHRDYRT